MNFLLVDPAMPLALVIGKDRPCFINGPVSLDRLLFSEQFIVVTSSFIA